MQTALAALCNDAGVSAEGQEYLAARGVTTVAIVALSTASEAKFVEHFVDPFITGVNIHGTNHKSTQDDLVTSASMLAAWEDARRARASMATATVTPIPNNALANTAALAATCLRNEPQAA